MVVFKYRHLWHKNQYMDYTQKIISSIFKSIFVGVFVCATFSVAMPAQAQYDYYTPVDDYYVPVDDYYTPYYGGDDYYTPVYDYYTPASTYYTPGYSYSGYGYDSYGYSGGDYYAPGYTYGGSSYEPVSYDAPTYVYSAVQPAAQPFEYTAPAANQNPVSVVVDNTNNNTNTNTNTNNNVITINNPAPVTTVVKQREYSRPEYRQPTYYQPPVYNYNSTPYVSLSAVPYTGLELGFWGTVVYWSVLVLWCLFAAYMLVVKRAHTKVATWFKAFLFGSTTVVVAKTVSLPAKREVVVAPQTLDKTDDFIMAQILRRA